MNKDISITYCKINDLRPFAGNPRKISDEEMAKLRRSVREFGVVDPVVAQQGTNMVIGGHQRLEAAKAEGVKTVPVVYLDIDDSRAHLLNVALNKISGEWDWSKLGDLFQELDSGDIDLELSGFDMGEIEGLMNGLDSANHEGITSDEGRRTLAERFGVPPFSVFDARQGYWQDRKRAWLALGIQSELGRGQNIVPNGTVRPQSQDGCYLRKLSPGGGQDRPVITKAGKGATDEAGRYIEKA
jgi:hypothetical protein